MFPRLLLSLFTMSGFFNTLRRRLKGYSEVSTECRRDGSTECRRDGSTECRRDESTECRRDGSTECSRDGSTACRRDESTECRRDAAELVPINGHTTFKTSTGTYTGNVRNGTPFGHGTFTMTNGRRCTGNWIDENPLPLPSDLIVRKSTIYDEHA